MFLLDADFLIRTLVVGSVESQRVSDWLVSGMPLATNSIAWMEVLRGPTPAGLSLQEIVRLETVLANYVEPFTRSDAILAARLFNQIGRLRARRFDCCIAATAIRCQFPVATANLIDFSRFVPFGLTLAL